MTPKLRIAGALIAAALALPLAGCSYTAYWEGHDMGSRVSPSEKEIMDEYTTCEDWAYMSGYGGDQDYMSGCQDGWEGN